tara:strand:+ start:1390 stop:1815 length:426 start_codon:yes stop_codon:yes gene_type:complete
MNLTNKVLKLLGMKLAADMLENPVPSEQKLFRAILTLALEDVLSNSQGRHESVVKAEAHDWFMSDSEDYRNVCYIAGLDSDWVRERYVKALDNGQVVFTMKQHLQVKYTRLYEDLRAAKDTGHRKLIQKEIDKLRKKIFKL